MHVPPLPRRSARQAPPPPRQASALPREWAAGHEPRGVQYGGGGGGDPLPLAPFPFWLHPDSAAPRAAAVDVVGPPARRGGGRRRRRRPRRPLTRCNHQPPPPRSRQDHHCRPPPPAPSPPRPPLPQLDAQIQAAEGGKRGDGRDVRVCASGRRVAGCRRLPTHFFLCLLPLGLVPPSRLPPLLSQGRLPQTGGKEASKHRRRPPTRQAKGARGW